MMKYLRCVKHAMQREPESPYPHFPIHIPTPNPQTQSPVPSPLSLSAPPPQTTHLTAAINPTADTSTTFPTPRRRYNPSQTSYTLYPSSTHIYISSPGINTVHSTNSPPTHLPNHAPLRALSNNTTISFPRRRISAIGLDIQAWG